MKLFKRIMVAAGLLVSVTCLNGAKLTVPLAETAAFLAGEVLPAGSTLAPVAARPEYKRFQKAIQAKWQIYQTNVMAPIRQWVKQWMPSQTKDFLFYPFAGGDFINAHLFYPKAKTILMIGLEYAGRIPALPQMNRWQLKRGLEMFDFGYKIFHHWNFYRTLGMQNFMNRSPLVGTIPHILNQMAWLGLTPLQAYEVKVSRSGKLIFVPISDNRFCLRMAIDYLDKDGTKKRVIYLQLDLRDWNLQREQGWYAYLNNLGKTDGFMKAASCLLPRSYYSKIRNIVLKTMTTIVQSDSCMPYRYLKKDWNITLFGKYFKAHYIFPSFTQPDLRAAYAAAQYRPVPFPFSYERPGGRRNMQLCIPRNQADTASNN